MKVLPVLASFILLIVFVRCGNSGATNDASAQAVAALPDTVDLAFQDTLFLTSRADWVLFDSLAHDSRCPTGATCVWEGNAEIGFSVYQDSLLHAFALNTHPNFRTDTTLAAGLSIAVLDLMPYPHVDSTYKAEQYTVQIYVSR